MWYQIKQKKLQKLRQMSCVSEDIERSYVYKRNKVKLVRFTSYNPATYPEGFFFSQLLHYVPFRDESHLKLQGSYFVKFMTSVVGHADATPGEVLEQHVKDYCTARMYKNRDYDSLINQAADKLQLDALVLHNECDPHTCTLYVSPR